MKEKITELRDRLKAVRDRLTVLQGDAEERSLTDEESTEIDELMAEFDEKRAELTKLEEREERLEKIRSADLGDDTVVERGDDRSTFNTNASSRTPEDIYDLDAYRSRARDDDDRKGLLRDGALKAVERAKFPTPDFSSERQRDHIDRLLKTIDHQDRFAEILLSTGSREYRSAFGKYLAGQPLTYDEQMLLARAASTANASGGYAIPFTLDPTVILTSAGAVNPFRDISRVETITTNNWHGVTSGGITASYDGEATEVSDDTPTLAQPSATVEKAQAFVPYSIEIDMDWAGGGFQAEIAREFADAKNVLEESNFTTGAGHGSTAPQGIITGATTTVSTATTAVLALTDVYAPSDNLPARWEMNASWLGHKKTFNKIKQLAQALSGGNVGVWADLGGGVTGRLPMLNGDPVYRGTTISNAYSVSNSKILVHGDFRQFLIVDRIGMSVEVVQHMLATANNLPNGQRGLYAYWRNTSGVLVPDAFRVLKVL